VPWLAYAALRCDFSDDYAALVFGKIVVINFVSAVVVATAYKAQPALFDRYFFPVGAVLGAALLFKAVVNPQVFIYASTIERMTIENANPIWLSRSFAIAAICVVFLPIKSRLAKLAGFGVFVLFMVPTGSRAPLISLLFVSIAYLVVLYKDRPQFALRVFAGGMVAIVGALIVGPKIYDLLVDFLSRGTSESVFRESGRLMLFRLAFEEFLSFPVFGVGLGQFGRAGTVMLYQASVGAYPHNIILEVLSGTGLVGLGLFCLVFRPGPWLLQITTPYSILFWLCVLFSMASGDLTGNSGVVIFGALARLSYHTGSTNAVALSARQILRGGNGRARPVHLHQ
jgi:hypothetical protein